MIEWIVVFLGAYVLGVLTGIAEKKKRNRQADIEFRDHVENDLYKVGKN